jgi:hypothetical protein
MSQPAPAPPLLRVLLANGRPYPVWQQEHRAHGEFLDPLAASCRIELFDGTNHTLLTARQLVALLHASEVHLTVRICEAPFGQTRIRLLRRAGVAPEAQPWVSIEILVPEAENTPEDL